MKKDLENHQKQKFEEICKALLVNFGIIVFHFHPKTGVKIVVEFKVKETDTSYAQVIYTDYELCNLVLCQLIFNKTNNLYEVDSSKVKDYFYQTNFLQNVHPIDYLYTHFKSISCSV